MKQLNLQSIIAKILIISIIFTSFPISGIALADDTQMPSGMQQDVQDWLERAIVEDNWVTSTKNSVGGSSVFNVEKYEYKEDGQEKVTYAVRMPKPDNNKVGFNANTGAYLYYVRDDNGNVIDQVEFYIDFLMSKNGTTDIAPGLNSVLEKNTGELIREIEIETREPDGSIIGYGCFAVTFPDGNKIETNLCDLEFVGESITQNIIDGITNTFNWLWDVTINTLGGIFNSLLLWIADGIQDLINSIFGSEEDLTIYKVIFGKIDKLSIDYWGDSTSHTTDDLSNVDDPDNPTGIVDNAPAPTLKSIVSYWYNIFRGIAITVYLVMLLYIGIRILLSSTGESAQKYKESLTAWLMGVLILAFYPYVMRYTVIINNALVGMVDNEAIATNASDVDSMLKIRQMAEEENNIALTVVYIIMLGQLIVLLGVYYKRAFMIAFLITIFPIVAGLFIWEKSKGGSNALGTWTKEYVILVLTQTFHAVTYVVLIDGALQAFNANGNWFILILSVMFLFEAEKIIRAIFGMKSSAGTIGDLATAGAAAWGATKMLKEKLKLGGKDKNTEDSKNAQNAANQIAEAKKQNAVNRALAQTTSSTTSTTMTSSSGSSGSGNSENSSSLSDSESAQQINPMDNLQAAQAFASQDAFKKRTKRNAVANALTALPRAYTRAAGITLGMASGLASGSVKDGIANAAIGNEFASMGTKAMRGITGWTVNRFAGKVMKAKILSGEMDEQLRDVGFDLAGSFDKDPTVSAAKAQIIREALAAQADATRKGGKAAGELAFVKAIEKGRKREHL